MVDLSRRIPVDGGNSWRVGQHFMMDVQSRTRNRGWCMNVEALNFQERQCIYSLHSTDFKKQFMHEREDHSEDSNLEGQLESLGQVLASSFGLVQADDGPGSEVAASRPWPYIIGTNQRFIFTTVG